MVLAWVKDPLLCWPSSLVTQGLSLRLTSVFSVPVHACSTEVFNSTGSLCVPPETRPPTTVSLAEKNHIKLRLGAFYVIWRSGTPKARDFLAMVVTRLWAACKLSLYK